MHLYVYYVLEKMFKIAREREVPGHHLFDTWFMVIIMTGSAITLFLSPLYYASCDVGVSRGIVSQEAKAAQLRCEVEEFQSHSLELDRAIAGDQR